MLGVELLVALAVGLVAKAAVAGLIVLGLAVLTPLALALRCWRSARTIAPAGFTLGLGFGAHHLAVRHAVATTVVPYSSWKSATQVGDIVVLQTRRGGVIPLPVELLGADPARLQALVGGTEDASAPAPAGPALPLEFVCTRSTRGRLTRALLVT